MAQNCFVIYITSSPENKILHITIAQASYHNMDSFGCRIPDGLVSLYQGSPLMGCDAFFYFILGPFLVVQDKAQVLYQMALFVSTKGPLSRVQCEFFLSSLLIVVYPMALLVSIKDPLSWVAMLFFTLGPFLVVQDEARVLYQMALLVSIKGPLSRVQCDFIIMYSHHFFHCFLNGKSEVDRSH